MATKPNTTNEAHCLECGQPLRGESLEGFCPRCLSRLAFDANSQSSAPAKALSRSVGDYELIEEIGRGGMGVVWKARQRSLNRIVALKFILTGSFASREFIERFRSEATAAARLKHPNIIAVHEVGEHEGHHYFSMDFIEGQSLTQLVRAEPPSFRQAARSLRLIAEAIHHAHERGIVHRDLKPTNILVDAVGEPHITDFGLARELNSEEHLTLTGQALGSPSFAAPEQIGGARLSSAAARPLAEAKSETGSQAANHAAAGRETRAPLTRSVDIYGLGAILYYLLTYRPPFAGSNLANILRAVQENEPVSPRVLNPEIPRDLETICLKCLEKEPARRYATAKELADELGCFLNDEPVHARPVSRTEKVWRWCRRKPALATLGALVLVLLVVVVFGAPIAIIRIDRARVDAERQSYSAHMRLASEALRKGQVGEVQELLKLHPFGKGVEDLYGFEWRYLQHAADQSGLVTRQLSGLRAKHFLVPPRLVAVGNTLYNHLPETGQILAWDMTTWLPVPLKLPSNRVSERRSWYLWEQAALAVNDKERTIAVYRLPSLEELSIIVVPGEASQTAVDPDLRTLAVAFQETNIQRILVWDLAANSQRWILGSYSSKVTGLTFSPDGNVLMAACADGEIGLWSITQGKDLPSPPRDASSLEDDRQREPFFGPGSTRLFFNRGREGKALEVWDWSTGKFSIAYRTRLGRLDAYDFSPDGALLACVFPGEGVVLLDAKESRRIGAIPASGARILDVAFSPSGRLIASVSLDRTAKLWEVKTLRELATLGDASGVLFTPDESSVLTPGSDGKISVWDLRALLGRGVVWHSTNAINAFAVSADDRAIATLDSVGGVHVRDLASGDEISGVQTGGGTAIDLLFSPTEHVLAWDGWTTVGILDYDIGQTNTYPIPGGVGHWRPAFTADGRELAFAAPTNIMILDMATRKVRPFAPIKNSVLGLAFSSNGLLLATADSGGDLTLWDRVTGRTITNYPAHSPMAFDVEFSPDGRLLASGGQDGIGKLWEVVPGGLKLLHTLRGHAGPVEVFFLPDGRLVSHGSGDNGLKLWDTKTGFEVGTLFGNGGRFAGFGRSRDGNTIYSATEDGDVRIWQAPPLNDLQSPAKGKPSGRREPPPNSKQSIKE